MKLKERVIQESKRFIAQKHREGQSLMNALHLINLPLYVEITATDADCFYNDSKIPAFFNEIEKIEKKDKE